MIDFEIVFWYWWVLAFVLLALELLVTGFFFLWMAIGGIVTGSIVLLVPETSLEVQCIIFSVISFVSIYVWRRYAKGHVKVTDHPLLNKRGEQYVGQVYSVVEAIKDGQGKIKVGDTYWKVKGEDCPVQSKVRVTAVQGVIFLVEHV